MEAICFLKYLKPCNQLMNTFKLINMDHMLYGDVVLYSSFAFFVTVKISELELP